MSPKSDDDPGDRLLSLRACSAGLQDLRRQGGAIASVYMIDEDNEEEMEEARERMEAYIAEQLDQGEPPSLAELERTVRKKFKLRLVCR